MASGRRSLEATDDSVLFMTTRNGIACFLSLLTDGFFVVTPDVFRRHHQSHVRSRQYGKRAFRALCPEFALIVQSRRIQKNDWPQRGEFQRLFHRIRGRSRRIGYDGHGLCGQRVEQR